MHTKNLKMPIQVWTLTLSAFAIGTAEFVIAGLLIPMADDLSVTHGQAGYLITAYALAIVIGGPLLTLWLARFEKRFVLIGLMFLFIIGNVITALSHDFYILLISRAITGLTQGPFYGIGAVVASHIVPKEMRGRAVGQMFAGLTLANVLGVPAGSWIGDRFGWQSTFFVIAALGLIAIFAILLTISKQEREKAPSVRSQITVFKNRNLIVSLLFTVLAWTGFMTFYGYIDPIAEQVAGFERIDVAWLLVVIGVGLVIGNTLGGKTSDINLRLSLILWPFAMIVTLIIAGLVAPFKWIFVIVAFFFGITTFANVPSMQMRVMKYGKQSAELASTANISAFNIANALGGVIGASILDHHAGVGNIPYVAALASTLGLLLICWEERRITRMKP